MTTPPTVLPPPPTLRPPSSFPPKVCCPHYTHTDPTLTLWTLIILIFYNILGVPIGTKTSICAKGNFYCILGFLLFPHIWSILEAAVIAELAVTFWEPSRGVAWVDKCFGVAFSMGSVLKQTVPFNSPCSWSTSQLLQGQLGAPPQRIFLLRILYYIVGISFSSNFDI